MTTVYDIDLHTWRLAGDAPSTGDGRRVQLTCVRCRASVVVRLRWLKTKRVHPCRCQTNNTHTH